MNKGALIVSIIGLVTWIFPPLGVSVSWAGMMLGIMGQKNGENKTLCHEIEKAFESVLGEYVKIVASGRTDAGVHALKQVAHFDMPKNSNLSLKNL